MRIDIDYRWKWVFEWQETCGKQRVQHWPIFLLDVARDKYQKEVSNIAKMSEMPIEEKKRLWQAMAMYLIREEIHSNAIGECEIVNISSMILGSAYELCQYMPDGVEIPEYVRNVWLAHTR